MPEGLPASAVRLLPASGRDLPTWGLDPVQRRICRGSTEAVRAEERALSRALVENSDLLKPESVAISTRGAVIEYRPSTYARKQAVRRTLLPRLGRMRPIPSSRGTVYSQAITISLALITGDGKMPVLLRAQAGWWGTKEAARSRSPAM